MFGQLRNVAYTLNVFGHQQQAITVKCIPNIIFEAKKGVRINLAYQLSKPYIGKKAYASFKFYAKDGTPIEIPSYRYLEHPIIDTVSLKSQDTLDYFLADFLWDNSIYKIKAALCSYDGLVLPATPYLLPKPILPTPPFKYTGAEIEEGVTVNGLQGVKLKVSYQSSALHKVARLQAQLKYKHNDQIVPFNYYKLENAYSKSISRIGVRIHARVSQNLWMHHSTTKDLQPSCALCNASVGFCFESPPDIHLRAWLCEREIRRPKADARIWSKEFPGEKKQGLFQVCK